MNQFKGFIDHVVELNNEHKGCCIDSFANNIEQNKWMDSLVQLRKTKDTAEKKYMLTHYFFTGNYSLIVHEHWNKDSILNVWCRKFYDQYKRFYYFINSLGKETLSNLKVEPLRFYKDKSFYNHFETYERKNSLIFF